MKQLLITQMVVTLCFGITLDCCASPRDEDHLVPIEKTIGLSATYEQLWRQKLLVTSGEIARFVGLPGTLGVETAISVYRDPGKKESLPGNYWVTATQASQRLWNCIQPGAKGQIDPNMIHIVRCDAPITESTALAVHKIWLTMLSQARPQRSSNRILVDSSREIFSAVDNEGKVWQAQNLNSPSENTKMLIDMALSLLEYCGTPEDRRPSLSRDIEKTASHMLARVAPSSGRKK